MLRNAGSISGFVSMRGAASHAALAVAALAASAADAQAAPNLVGACSGVSLPRSVVTGIVGPVITGVAVPTQNRVNGLIGLAGAIPGVPAALNIDTTGLLADAAAGDPIGLQALNRDGTALGPNDRCDLRADSYGLDTEAGIAIGGNRITGLGSNGLDASAGEAGSIALGNSAATDAGATRSIAIGTGARATSAEGVALGAGSVANRGALASYTALGLATPQNSAGDVSVGAAGAERQISNVAAGSATTDAANVGQVAGVNDRVTTLGYDVATLDDLAVRYDDSSHARVTLGGNGSAPVTLGNVAAGTIAAGSTDAVNGAQLHDTNVAVANNTTAITNLSAGVTNGGVGPVQYSSPGSPTTPNGGTRTNDLTLVGAAAAPVALHNVAGGRIAAGSTDAVNGGQVYALAGASVNAVTYDTDANGDRTNTVTLTGGAAAAPVTLRNVADGSVAASSTEAVNGGQLYTTNQAVTGAQATADTALTLGQNSVQYDTGGRTDVSLGDAGTPVIVHNVGAGTAANDAVNVAQLGQGIGNAVTQANSYTDSRIAALHYDLRAVRKDASAGTAGALAAAGLPQVYTAGAGMVAMALGAYEGETAFALGFSKAMNDGHTVVKLGGTYDTQQKAGASAGVGYQF